MTTLYIKTHNMTGLKYFGKTTRNDVHKYSGSGKYWLSHIKKHGYNIQTHIYAQFDETDYIERILLQCCALMFSIENDIVNSKEWANLKPENGLDGSAKGSKHSEEVKAKMSRDRKGRNGTLHSNETKALLSSIHSGKVLSEEHKKNIRISRLGKKHHEDTLKKMSAWQKGLPKERVRCPYCKTVGAGSNMKRYHFGKCKLKDSFINAVEGSDSEEHF
jgi:hypothetical protein